VQRQQECGGHHGRLFQQAVDVLFGWGHLPARIRVRDVPHCRCLVEPERQRGQCQHGRIDLGE
jgi:hypothetical protein